MVRALDCGSRGRGFESHLSPKPLKPAQFDCAGFLFHMALTVYRHKPYETKNRWLPQAAGFPRSSLKRPPGLSATATPIPPYCLLIALVLTLSCCPVKWVTVTESLYWSDLAGKIQYSLSIIIPSGSAYPAMVEP